MPTRDAHDPTLTRPIAAPLERCAELLGVDLTAIVRVGEPVLRSASPCRTTGGYPQRCCRS